MSDFTRAEKTVMRARAELDGTIAHALQSSIGPAEVESAFDQAIADCPIAIPTEVYHRPPGDVLVHHRGELQVGPHIRVWCVCGIKWEGEGRRAAEQAWKEHLA